VNFGTQPPKISRGYHALRFFNSEIQDDRRLAPFLFRGCPLSAGCKTGDRGTMAHVTEPLVSLSLSLRSISSFESGALTSLRVDDDGITSETRVSVGVRILVIVSFSLILAESNTTQIYLQSDSAARNFRTRAEPHSLPSR